MTKLTVEQVKHFPSVQKWLYGEKYYKSKNRYLGWMALFCYALDLNPDQIMENIKTAKSPVKEMKKQRAELTAYFRCKGKVPKKGKPYIVGTVDKRMNALNSFNRANGINMPQGGELVRELRIFVWDCFGLPPPY